MSDANHGERRIHVTAGQFALGIAASYAFNLAVGALIVLAVFAFVGIFYNHIAEPAAHVSTQEIVVGTNVICVLLMIAVAVLVWGARALLRRKPWQAGMFIILLCGCLFLFFPLRSPGGRFLLFSPLCSWLVCIVLW